MVMGSYHLTTILNQTNDIPQKSMDNTANMYTFNDRKGISDFCLWGCEGSFFLTSETKNGAETISLAGMLNILKKN